MHQFEIEGNTYFIADEVMFYEDGKPEYPFPNLTLRAFVEKEPHGRILEARRVETSQGYAILDAHANSFRGKWHYEDKRQIQPIQEWVDRVDGSYSALLIFCCNPDNLQIQTQKSIAMHPSRNFQPSDALAPRFKMRLWMPGQGYIEKDKALLAKLVTNKHVV